MIKMTCLIKYHVEDNKIVFSFNLYLLQSLKFAEQQNIFQETMTVL